MSLRSRMLTFVVVVCLSTAAVAQFGRGATPKGTVTTEDGPDLVSQGSDPVIRYPVAHQHTTTGCAGYLYVSRTTIKFEVLGPPQDKAHAFELKRSDLTTAQQWRFWGTTLPEAEYKFRGGGTYHFFRVHRSWVENVQRTGNQKLDWADVLPFQELIDVVMDFDGILDKIAAREARLRPAPPAAPPVISMLDPVGAEAGKVLDIPAARVHLRGVASHASGIASVTVNNAAAITKPLAPTTVEFQVSDFAVNPGASAIVIVANAADKSSGQLIFTMNHPDVRIVSPAMHSETDKEAVKVHGVAVGFRAIDLIEVAGKKATIQTNPTGEVEFEADAVPLTVGDNNLQGFVAAHDGSRMPFKVAVKRNPPPGPPPLALNEVVDALQKGVPAARVASLVSQFGVSFALTDDAEKQLRSAGADTNLLLVIAKAKK